MKSSTIEGVFPNPVSSILQIGLASNEQETEVKILDVNDRIIMRTKTSDTLLSLHVEGLSKGIYFVKIEGREGLQKFVKL